jgi:ankyrin repeat domain-containing protein 17
LGNNTGKSPLFVASEVGHYHICKCLLDFGADINLCNNMISTSDLSKHLTTSQCPCCDATNNGDSCLSSPHKLISAPNLSKHLTTSQLLWDDATNNGDCPNLGNNIGKSPLFVASEVGHYHICKCLLNFGADINLCNNIGKSPVFVASEEGHYDIYECLFKSG